MVTGQLDGFTHFGDDRVADDAAKFDKFDALIRQAGADAGKQAIALDAIAAIGQQHLLDAVGRQDRTDLLFFIAAEFDAGRVIKTEVIHGDSGLRGMERNGDGVNYKQPINIELDGKVMNQLQLNDVNLRNSP